MMNVEIVLYKQDGFENVPFRCYFRFVDEKPNLRQAAKVFTGPYEDDYIEYRHMANTVPYYLSQLIYDHIDYEKFCEKYKEMEIEDTFVIKEVAITNLVVWLNKSIYIDYHGKQLIIGCDKFSKDIYELDLVSDNKKVIRTSELGDIMPYLYFLNDNMITDIIGLINTKLLKERKMLNKTLDNK